MRAVGYEIPLPIFEPDALVDIELPAPEPGPHDLLVSVRAVSVNPLDTKVRVRSAPEHGWRVLGFDAAGIVTAVGRNVSLFKPGDEVFYAGALERQGTNAEFHAVDERLVGHKPKSLSFAAAAALPLTALTAWEMLFDRLDIATEVPGAAKAVLIIGGAGGVASIAIQLVRQLSELAVIATASNPESSDWVKSLGADYVVDHGKPLAGEIAALGLGAPGIVFSINHSQDHLPEIAALIAPQGRLGVIDSPEVLDINPFKSKSISVHWESMFTRSMYQTADMGRQGQILNEVAALADAGMLRTTLGENFGPIDAETLKRAHELIESGKAKGKIVLEGFGP